MASWSSKKPACILTWYALAMMQQHKKNFPRSETLKVKNLQFWTSASSADFRTAAARGVAMQLDAMFRGVNAAKYEAGVRRDAALSALHDALKDGETSLPDLAAVVDAHYRFLGESP
jgi:hypothetical protein